MKKFIGAIIAITLATAAQAQGTIVVPSLMPATITVIETKTTPMSELDFCTLLTGNYCGEMPQKELSDRVMFDPTRFYADSVIFVRKDQ